MSVRVLVLGQRTVEQVALTELQVEEEISQRVSAVPSH